MSMLTTTPSAEWYEPRDLLDDDDDDTRAVPRAGHRRAALSPRGTAACRLSDFQDAWAEVTQADRAWFADWLTELLVDACQEPAATR